jgi:hypothetical protein
MKYQDEGPMTPEKAIKLKGHEIIMRLNAVGVPWDKCNLAALVVALELKAQFKKLFNGPEAERNKRLKHFEKLEEGIKGFLPMGKEEILSRFTEEIEKASNEAETISQFKTMVLDIIKNPKTKFKLFI